MSALTGIAGAALGEGLGAFSRAFGTNRSFNAMADFLDAPLEQRIWADVLNRISRATFYLKHPRGTPFPVINRTSVIGASIAPAVGLGISNSGPLVDLSN